MVHLTPMPYPGRPPPLPPPLPRCSLPIAGASPRANGDLYQTFELKPDIDPLRRKYIKYLNDSGGIQKFRQEPEPGLCACCERKVACCTCCFPRGQMNTVAVSVICVCVIVFIVLSPLLHFMVPT